MAVVVTVVAVRVTMGVPLRSADGGCRWAVACVLVCAMMTAVLVLAVVVVPVLAVIVVAVLAVVVVPVVVAGGGLLAVDVSLTSGHRG